MVISAEAGPNGRPARTPPAYSVGISGARQLSIDAEAEELIGNLIDVIKGIRNMRAEVNIPTGKKEKAVILAEKPELWERFAPYIKRLAWTEPLEILDQGDPDVESKRPRQALTSVATGAEVFLPLEGVIDIDKEIARLEKTVAELREDLDKTAKRLSDKEFLSKAPEQVVDNHRKRHEDNQEKLQALINRVEMLAKIKG